MTRFALLVPAMLVALAATAVACDSPTTPTTHPDAAHSVEHLIRTKGHRLAFYVTPGHLPAIVLDSGGGLDASYWDRVGPVLAKDTGSEIITYDRAGLGASDDVTGPWQPGNAVSDLDAGLTQLGVTHDVILVAHSEAGEIATYFVRAHPGVVAGAVLVDATLPGFYTDDEIARIVAQEQPQLAALNKQPPTKANRQLLAVAADFVPVQTAYHQIDWPSSVPTTVIVSATTPFDPSSLDARSWRAAQTAFAAAAPNRALVTATGSSHDVPLDRPDVVIHQIETMVGRIRR